MNRYIQILFLYFISVAGFSQQYYSDQVLDKKVNTVLLYPDYPGRESSLEPSITHISQQIPMILEFDYMGDQAPYFNVRIIHCNYDWSKSALRDLEFMNEYNSIPINDVLNSGATYIPYVHYFMQLPKVKLSGNYVVEVFWEDAKDDVVFTKRFSVYENRVGVGGNLGFSKVVRNMAKNQQIDFSVNYGNYQVDDPYNQLKVVLRQNFRWDNAKYDLKPSIVRNGIIDYNFFGGENDFQGLNEYRIVDFRNLNSPRFGVDRVETLKSHKEVFLRRDVSRGYMNYVSDLDYNGQYFVGNDLIGNASLEADYVWVNFQLFSPERANGDVYIFGELSNWEVQESFKMQFDLESTSYYARVLLKQGVYNWSYSVFDGKQLDEIYYEGSHNLTQNDYDILVYHRPFGTYADLLVGYKEIGD